MPLMTKMRERMSIVFGIFAVLFIIYIVLDWGLDISGRKSRGLSGKHEVLGSVNGKEISYAEFEEQVKKYVEMVKQQYKITDLDENMMNQIHEEVWNTMVMEILTKQELTKMGMDITDQELRDWFYKLPETLPEQIARNFKDSTGNINFSIIQNAITRQEPEVKQFFLQVEDMLRQQRSESKIASLILSHIRVTEGELIQKYKDENIKADGKFVTFDPNLFVPDNTISVSDADIKAYYDEHKEDYKQEEGRKLRIAHFPIMPSKQDTNDILGEMKIISEEIKKGTDFKSLIDQHSETKYNDSVYVKHGEIGSDEIEKSVFDAKIGDMIGPIQDGNTFRIFKVFGSREGKDQFYHSAHILLKFNANNKDSVKKEALNLLNRVKKGESIFDLAFKYSEDPSAKQNKGDLGWKGKGAFVKPFEDAANSAKVGEVVGPVESSFGFHIIKILSRESKELNLGDIKLTIIPSSQTKEDVYNSARDFMNLAKDGDFLKEAQISKADVQETPVFTKNGVVPGIGYNNSISKFAFKNKIGTTSEVFKISNAYIVVQVSDIRKEGYRDLNEIKEGIKALVTTKKKLDALKSIVADFRNKLSASDSLNKLSQVDGRLQVTPANSFSMSTAIPGIGRDNKVLAKVFNLNPNTISQPIEGSRAYYLFSLSSKTGFDQNDYNAKRTALYNQILQEKQNTFYSEWRKNLMDKADIVDNRDKFSAFR
jgi:peptidyl-prolyl cis-trans isomerase D